jgi:hypothetical protein
MRHRKLLSVEMTGSTVELLCLDMCDLYNSQHQNLNLGDLRNRMAKKQQ